MKLTFVFNTKKRDTCDGCKLSSCGHGGAEVFCKLGFGRIKNKYRNPRKMEGFYWVRPKKCIDYFKEKKQYMLKEHNLWLEGK
jgi:hypothetical protein